MESVNYKLIISDVIGLGGSMVQVTFLAMVAALFLSGCSNIVGTKANVSTVYLNKSIGFDVAGYNYSQTDLVCDLDSYLVDSLVSRASDHNIQILDSSQSVGASGTPIIAVDIDELVIGQNDQDFTGHMLVEPKLGITLALIDGDQGMINRTSSSCVSFGNQLVLENAASGRSNCGLLKQCARRLSDDVMAWLAPQLSKGAL